MLLQLVGELLLAGDVVYVLLVQLHAEAGGRIWNLRPLHVDGANRELAQAAVLEDGALCPRGPLDLLVARAPRYYRVVQEAGVEAAPLGVVGGKLQALGALASPVLCVLRSGNDNPLPLRWS